MSAQTHAAYGEEKARLEGTLRQVDAQLKRRLAASEIVIEETDQDEESMHAIRAAQEALETLRDSAIEQLAVAAREPYFGRLDFAERGSDQVQRLYIGKHGLVEEGSDRPLVIDWRAPVASLFYGAPVGEEGTAYHAPDGRIEGRIALKRNLNVRQRRLRQILDARAGGGAESAAGGADTYLLYKLQESRDNKLRDIVSSIQQEQNQIIRAAADRPLIIQGVAGSGKTTVALHRLAYLLYTYRDSMDAERMVIFAPSRMFLDYIADVLPELGVGSIKQVTFADWALDVLMDPVTLTDPVTRLEELFAPGWEQEGPDSPGRFKGSLFFRTELDRALDRYEAAMVPEPDLILWEGARVRYREIYGWFHRDYAHYPINTRKERIISRLRTWARNQFEPYRGTLEEPERRKAMLTAVRKYVALWPRHTPLSLYREILGLGQPRGKRPAELGAPQVPEAIRKEARERMKGKLVAHEDLAPLLYLQERLHGLREDRQLDHIVIDEAQDFSPLQIDLLRRLTRQDSFSILGDLSQGIHTHSGITGWEELMAVFPAGTGYYELDRSYRTTYEIMTFANQALLRGGVTEGLARPVFREGERVRLRKAEQLADAVAAEVRQMRERHASIAVVTRTAASAERMRAELRERGLDPELIRADQKRYLGGLSVIPSYLTKGLEFDGVIVAGAGRAEYGLSQRDTRLLYVVLTRALHQLTVLYTGSVTPLLERVPPELVDAGV